MFEFNVWDNKEIYQKYPKVNSAVLNYFMSESDISTRGKDIDFDIKPKQYDDLDEWLAEEFAITPEIFYDSYHYFEELLENAKFYTSDTGEVVIELSDEPVLNRIDNPELDEITWMNLVDDSLAKFEDLTEVTAYTLGRSGRHVCVDFNLENLIGFSDLKDVVEKLQKQLIKDANSANLNESIDTEVSIDSVIDAFKVNGPHSRQGNIPKVIDTAFNIINIKDNMRPKSYELDRVDDNIQFTWVTQEPFKHNDLMLFEKELIRAFTKIAKSVGYDKEFTVMYDVSDRDGEDHHVNDIIINGSINESFGYDTSVDDSTAYEINAKFNDDVDFDTKIVDRDELYSFVTKIAEINDDDEPENDIDAIITFLSDYDIYISQPKNEKSKEITLESVFNEPDEVVTFKKNVDLADDKEEIQSLIYELSDGVAEYDCQAAFDEFEDSSLDVIKSEVISAIDSYLEDNDWDDFSDWVELASKSVEDSNGFLTDYTLYTNGETYVCIFGDKELYTPDTDDADFETESEKVAWDWYNSYTGFADDEDDTLENINNTFDESASTGSLVTEDDTDSIIIDDSILKHSDEFKYQLLSRMQTDCKYFLGAGNRAEKFLWAENVPEQIAYMRAIYNSFPDNKKPEWISLADIDEYEKKMLKLDESLDVDDELDHPEQEFDSAKTSINSSKLPAVYKMISIPKGSVGVDFGGGSFDNAVEYISDLGATLYVYDPYNRSAEHNKEVIEALKENGGADWAINSNVLNVIKEPEAREAVLRNISKITKPNAPIYITVYEGRGDSKEGPTKSGYQLNRKTQDYLEEIQKVFPDAKRKGKLITAHNTRSSTSSINENSDNTSSDGYVYAYCDNCGKKNRIKVHFKDYFSPFDDTKFECKYCRGHNLLHDPHLYDDSGEIYGIETNESFDTGEYEEIRKAILGDKSAIQSLRHKGYEVRKLINPLQYSEVGTFEITDPVTHKFYNYDNMISAYSQRSFQERVTGSTNTLESATKTIVNKLRMELKDKVHEVMTSSNFGFEEGEVDEYSVVEVTEKDGIIKAEVRAELNYDDLFELCQALNPVVEKYDKNAYFEPVEPGIIEAYI